MNSGIADHDATIRYYDGDYPSPIASVFPENFDEITKAQGLCHDIQRYQELAHDAGAPILELCCGTGRVAIPLAQAGYRVVGVDLSKGMLQAFRENLDREKAEVKNRIQLIQMDISRLELSDTDFPLAIIAFNSLLCLPDFSAQRSALKKVAKHLRTGGVLALDVINPLRLHLQGDKMPKPFFTRRNPHTGNKYTRFAMVDAMDAEHRQRLHGWYDEIDEQGIVHRHPYSMFWRPIFRFELELMLEEANMEIVSIEGGHQHETYLAESQRMFVIARKQ